MESQKNANSLKEFFHCRVQFVCEKLQLRIKMYQARHDVVDTLHRYNLLMKECQYQHLHRYS